MNHLHSLISILYAICDIHVAYIHFTANIYLNVYAAYLSHDGNHFYLKKLEHYES